MWIGRLCLVRWGESLKGCKGLGMNWRVTICCLFVYGDEVQGDCSLVLACASWSWGDVAWGFGVWKGGLYGCFLSSVYCFAVCDYDYDLQHVRIVYRVAYRVVRHATYLRQL